MRLKPKSTVHNNRAVLYRRFTEIKQSFSDRVTYVTNSEMPNKKFWVFDSNNETFIERTKSVGGQEIVVASSQVFKYKDKYCYFVNDAWTISYDLPEGSTLLSVQYSNIAQYQTNAYYYVGTFDYMIKGSIEDTETQYIKGNIMPTRSFTIKYFDDNIKVDHDDLLVLDKRLYGVESVAFDMKMQPKPFKVYFATVNSIL